MRNRVSAAKIALALVQCTHPPHPTPGYNDQMMVKVSSNKVDERFECVCGGGGLPYLGEVSASCGTKPSVQPMMCNDGYSSCSCDLVMGRAHIESATQVHPVDIQAVHWEGKWLGPSWDKAEIDKMLAPGI